jgi:hypothetical protein
MIILVVLIQTTLFAQSTQTIEKPLKLTSVAIGTLSDDVLLSGASDKIVKKINIATLLSSKANIASPSFTGSPTAPTQTAGDNSAALATTAFVTAVDVLKENRSNKGISNGYAGLDGAGKVPLTQINDALLGSVNYKGTYNATTNVPTLPTAGVDNKGWYYVINIAGTQQSIPFTIGDWIISNGTSWGKVDNNNTVTAVNGFLGNVILTTSNIADAVDKRYQTDNQKLYNDASSSVQNQLNTKAPLLSPIFTGTPSLPTGTIGATQTAGNNTTLLATTAFVTTADNLKANLNSPVFTGIATAPTQIAGDNTTALATTAFVTTADNLKAPLASPTFTGTPNLPTGTTGITQTAGNNTTALATTAFVTTADNLKANLASPAFTGIPTAPTQTAGNNTTAIATTAFVLANAIATTGNQTKSGQFTINNTLGATEGLVVNNSSSGSTTNGIFSYNSNTGRGINATNVSTGDALFVNNINAGRGIVLTNQSTGLGSLFQNTGSGTAIYLDVSSTGKAVVINNSTAATGIPFTIQKNSIDKLTISDAGQVTGTAYNIFVLNTAPTTATSTGTLGEIRFTASGIYICTATNTWIKCVGATF